MSKLVTSDNLKAYHGELAEHLQLLERDKAYLVGDTVKYDGLTLKCTIAGNTDVNKVDYSSIDIGDTIVDGTVTFTVIDPNSMWYEEDKFYMLDDIVVYNDKFYKCITAHTATATFDTAKWSEISAGGGGSSGGGISVWASNTQYAVNDVVIDSNLIWQCAVAHTSTSSFDESNWICISGGKISNGMEIVPLWEGSFSFSNSTQGATPTSSTPMIELSDSISNFEYIRIFTKVEQLDKDQASNLGYVPYLINNGSMRCGAVAQGNTLATCEAKFYDSTHVFIRYADIRDWSSGEISRIEGIRKAKPIVSSGMKYETLWEGEAGNISSTGSDVTINLNESLKKYKKLGFNLIAGSGGQPRYYYKEMSVDEFMIFIDSSESNRYIPFTWNGTGNDYFELTSTTTDVQLKANYKNNKITKITGISEGVQIPTGVQAARVTLWEGFNRTLNSIQTLSDSIKNYDQFEVTYANNGSDELKTHLFNVSDINNFSENFHCDGFASWGNPPYYFVLTFYFVSETTWKLDSVQGNGWNFGITKITGIKYIQPDSYSTEEKLIGTWIDGKPLYRKVFVPEGSLTPNNRYATNLNGTDYNIISLRAMALADGTYITLGFNNGPFVYAFGLEKSTGNIWVQTNYTNYEILYIIVEYTKN